MKKYNFDVYEKENGEAPFSVYLVSILSPMVSRKKTQKTPSREITKSKEYRKDYLERNE